MRKLHLWTVLTWLSAMVVSYDVRAQQADPWPSTIKLTFDATGKLVSFPPAIVRDHRQICLRVSVPQSFLLNQIHVFKSMLKEAQDTLNARKEMYKCFF